MTLVEFPATWLVGAAIVLGLLFGSFLNVVIHRLPRGQNIAFPPSTCPACGGRIAPYDNIPVFSWLILRGKARCCGAPIAVRYPLVELLGGAVGWGVMQGLILQLEPDTPLLSAMLLFLAFFALSLGLLAALFIDLEHMLLPDEITFGGTLLGLLVLPLRDDLSYVDAAIGGVVGFLIVWLPFDVIYRQLRGHPGMGLGDAKLLMLAGVWLGWPGVVFSLLAGAVQGTITAIGVFVARGKIDEPAAVKAERDELQQQLAELSEGEREELLAEIGDDVMMSEPKAGLGQARLPFGPFLILAMFEFMFFGEWIRSTFIDVFWQY